MATIASFSRDSLIIHLSSDKEKSKAIVLQHLTKIMGNIIEGLSKDMFCRDESGRLLLDGKFEWQLPLTIQIITEQDGPSRRFNATAFAEGEWLKRE